LQVAPKNRVCFEDSFNGMVDVKAARLKCEVVTHASEQDHSKWGAAEKSLATIYVGTFYYALKNRVLLFTKVNS